MTATATARLEAQVAALTGEVVALRREVGQLRDEVGFEGAFLRQDVANKVLSLGRSLATRYELIQLVRKVHRQLLVLRADLEQGPGAAVATGLTAGLGAAVATGLTAGPGAAAGGPATPEWFEVRAMDSAPHPWERPPKKRRGRQERSGSDDRHDTEVSSGANEGLSSRPGTEERPVNTLALSDPRPSAQARGARP
jgi:hypothetical protein